MNKLVITIVSIVALGLATHAKAGDPIPGVDVAIEQVPGGVVYTGNVNEAGQLVFQNLPKGKYRIINPETNTPQVYRSKDKIRGGKRNAKNASTGQQQRVNNSGDLPQTNSHNSTRSNSGALLNANSLGEDEVPSAEDFNSSRSNIDLSDRGIAKPNNSPPSGRSVRAVSGPAKLKRASGNKPDIIIVSKRGDVVIEFD